MSPEQPTRTEEETARTPRRGTGWIVAGFALVLLVIGGALAWRPLAARYWITRFGSNAGKDDEKVKARLKELGRWAHPALIGYIAGDDPREIGKVGDFGDEMPPVPRFWNCARTLSAMGEEAEDELFAAIARSRGDPERCTRLCASLQSFKTERALRAYARALQNPGLDVGNKHRFGEHSAVRAALWYLLAWQRADGSWAGPEDVTGGASDVEVTGICTLAFLGAGHTGKDGTFGFVVNAAVEWLMETQRADGCLDPESMLGHAATAAALSEAYGMSKEQKLVVPAQKAVNWLESQQTPGGGWAARAGSKPDVQTTMTCVMALKSAKIAGLSVQPQAWQQVLNWLKRTTVAEGPQKGLARPAEGEPPTPAACGASLLSRQYMGFRNDDPAMLRLADEVLKNMPAVVKDPRGALYCDYAMFQTGGERWKTWKSFLWKRLLGTQEARPGVWGSWPVRNASERHFGRAGTTALRAMCMEIYYGYQRKFEM